MSEVSLYAQVMVGLCVPLTLTYPLTLHPWIKTMWSVQGYLAHKKQRPPRILQ